jgi:bifunctional DNA-binding transcriptional regulator/antitoxin component of YhaV-PrlF toxin-antitoxin module
MNSKASAGSRRRRRGETRVTAKHQITIPVSALRAAGLGPGDVLVARAEANGRIVLERATDPLARFAGTIANPDGYLDALRSEWPG